MTLCGDYYQDLVSGRNRGLWPCLLRGGLRAASVPYGLASRLRNRFYDWGWQQSRCVPVPVVSIGNLTLGGTGKTPCVEYVARFYRGQNRRVAILSRGYGSTQGRNDEALVLEENLPDVPHLQGADRVALAAVAVEELESEVLVLDDGFQHRRLARDLDVVLIDATQPWGYGHLFPRGLLREGRGGLRRAGVVVLTRCDQVGEQERGRLREAIARLAPAVPVAEARHRPLGLVNGDRHTRPLQHLADRPVAAFCGIGNPAAFRRTLADLGVRLAVFRSFPDHHVYTRTGVEDLRAWARRQGRGCVAVTTQKDLVKLRLSEIGGKELWALRIGLHFEAGSQALDRRLVEVASTSNSACGVRHAG
ncbi:MAG TPA: tetraacyldisaccharide 4'-kinase [Gemmataceae bacterium]|nr:tetraacyldisaccharide 4'-kinase [Gemmataceae bacterium]